MDSAKQSSAGLTAAPREWDTETWPGFGARRPSDSFVPVGYAVQIGGRTLLDIEQEVAVRLLEACGGDPSQAAASLQIEDERLADLLGPPPGGPVPPWDLPPVEEFPALVVGDDWCFAAQEVPCG